MAILEVAYGTVQRVLQFLAKQLLRRRILLFLLALELEHVRIEIVLTLIDGAQLDKLRFQLLQLELFLLRLISHIVEFALHLQLAISDDLRSELLTRGQQLVSLLWRLGISSDSHVQVSIGASAGSFREHLLGLLGEGYAARLLLNIHHFLNFLLEQLYRVLVVWRQITQCDSRAQLGPLLMIRLLPFAFIFLENVKVFGRVAHAVDLRRQQLIETRRNTHLVVRQMQRRVLHHILDVLQLVVNVHGLAAQCLGAASRSSYVVSSQVTVNRHVTDDYRVVPCGSSANLASLTISLHETRSHQVK